MRINSSDADESKCFRILKYMLYIFSFFCLGEAIITILVCFVFTCLRVTYRFHLNSTLIGIHYYYPSCGNKVSLVFMFVALIGALLGLVVWTLYLIWRGRKPGYLNYWKPK